MSDTLNHTDHSDADDRPPALTGDGVACDAAAARSVRDRLVRLAYRFLWDHDDAEDIVQDALAVVHERRAELRESGKWWSWVSRIVVQRCHLAGRHRQRWQRHQEPYQQLAMRQRGAAEAQPGTGDLTDLVKASIRVLPRRQQEVVVLRHIEGMSYEQIGELLEMSPATARVHARAGLEGIRESVLKHQASAFEGWEEASGSPS